MQCWLDCKHYNHLLSFFLSFFFTARNNDILYPDSSHPSFPREKVCVIVLFHKSLPNCHCCQVATHQKTFLFFSFFCILSSCARQTSCLIDKRLRTSFRSKGIYHCCFLQIFLLDYHQWLSTHWKAFPLFSFFVVFHLVPGKHFGWLVGGTGLFRYVMIAAFWKFPCWIVIVHWQLIITGNLPENIPFSSFSMYSFILCQSNFLVDW